jgi:hypothetical protein
MNPIAPVKLLLAALRKWYRPSTASIEMVQRIAALILLPPDLDANYQAAKAETWPRPGSD